MPHPLDPCYLPIDFKARGTRFKHRKLTTRLIIHSLDTTPKWKFDIREIDRWHREENKWAAIGYHYVITRDGIIVEGRPHWAIGAHTRGWNKDSVAIALAGGKGAKADDLFSKHYTVDQSQMLHMMVAAVKDYYPKVDVVCGHHDHPKVTKTCPGFNVRRWLNGEG